MAPTLPTTHHHALLATARVAGMAGLLITGACSKQASPSPTALPATTRPAPAMTSDSDVVPEPLSDDALKTCQDITSKALAKVDFGAEIEPGGWADQASPEVKACCTIMLATDADVGDARWGCCALTGNEGMACTPWGPPVPPAMA